MKTIWIFMLFMFFTFLSLYSQDINLIKDGQTIPKGELTLKNGQVIKFNRLMFDGEKFNFRHINNIIVEKNISEVYTVTKSGSYAGYGALGGGLFGLLICLTISAADMQSQQDAWGGFPDGLKVRPSTTGWLITTSACTGIGALIGACFSKKKVYYENNSIVKIYPSFSNVNDNCSPMLSLKISLR